MKHETAGDPISGLKWTRRTTGKIAEHLGDVGINVSPNTVARLLKDLGYSLRVNHKKLSSGSGADRDEQFSYIAEMREQYAQKGYPVISVDTKKKELVGNFKNAGTAWNKQPVRVNDHDFRSDAEGLAIPYGIYDVQANRGAVFLGWSHDTPEFAVSSIEKWYRYDGRRRYDDPTKLLILADCGGSNGYRTRSWKYYIQKKLCDSHGLKVTVCHYPSGASKWNPIEHRLFSEISKNWAGRPLDSWDTIMNYINTTTTATGLVVNAYFAKKEYPTAVKISEEQMDQIHLEKHETLPKWNYSLSPS
jgi:hypothetical protein